MGEIHSPLPVKLFVGMLSPDPALFADCADKLSRQYGPLEYQSQPMPWDKTDYYREEMGDGILRKFLFFAGTIDPGKLPGIKHFTNSLEQAFAVPDRLARRRRINLDPGYLTEAKVVLATTKDYAHRLYIGENMYAEVTLRYDGKERSFTPHEFTYPDFRSREYLTLFNRVRQKLREELHGKSGG